MIIKNIIKGVKVGFLVVIVVPPVINGTMIIARGATNIIKNKINNSEIINNVKKDFELRKEGIVTVKYENI